MTSNTVARREKFKIICPYCFNKAGGGTGEPFFHTDVEFRAETSFADESFFDGGFENEDLFLRGVSKKYQRFWDKYYFTTEQEEDYLKVKKLWELPIIGQDNGVVRPVADDEGFVVGAVDIYGKTTYRRVCPHCHNPLPLGYGKYPVKFLSVIGPGSSGKTVYISQLLKNLSMYTANAGLIAVGKSPNESDFISMNKVSMGDCLPLPTDPRRFSQPVLLDLVYGGDKDKSRVTVVIYDASGEVCADSNAILDLSEFVVHSDGMILMIDPKGMRLVEDETGCRATNTHDVLSAVYHALDTAGGKKCKVPVAVTLSKSDSCLDILPQAAGECPADTGTAALPKGVFDGASYNKLAPELARLIKQSAPDTYQHLFDYYIDYNFFAVSALGCQTDDRNAPTEEPRPVRIEEPFLWLCKQWGMLRSNEKVLRPEKLPHAPDYEYEKRVLGKPILTRMKQEFTEYEEDRLRTRSRVKIGDSWEPFEEYRHLMY